jgi:hypothetical protein
VRLALAALDSLPGELERSRRLLPQAWVHELEACLKLARAKARAVQAIMAGTLDELLLSEEQRQEPPVHFLPTCSSCGKVAVGLRACGRCRLAKYCR